MPIVLLDGPLPDLAAAFLDAHIVARGTAHWRWKYRGATPERPLGVFHTDAHGAVTGFIGLMPTTLLQADGTEVRAAWLVDWVAAPGAGVGVGLGLLRKIQAMIPLPLTLGGSAVAHDMYTQLGWTRRPIADVFLLRLSGHALVDRGPLRRHPLLRAPARLAAAVASRALRLRRPAAPGVVLERIERFPETWDLVWAERRTELAPCLDRGRAELDWKFVDYPDDHGYRCFLVREASRIVGHLVLRVDAARGGRRGRVIDLTWPAARPELCEWLVREGCWRLQEERVDFVQCTASHPALVRALGRCRFAKVADLPVRHHKLPAGVSEPGGWFVTYLDCDRAWR